MHSTYVEQVYDVTQHHNRKLFETHQAQQYRPTYVNVRTRYYADSNYQQEISLKQEQSTWVNGDKRY
jgi:hypothetical protein